MVILWRVTEVDGDHGDYCDVIGGSTALEVARKYAARIKQKQVEEIEGNRREYDTLVQRGEIDPKVEPFDQSGYQCAIVLPRSITCVPQFNTDRYHDPRISSDRKYEALAWNAMWDWSRAEEVKL